MRRFWVFGILALGLFLFAGCTAEVVVPISYGSAEICSGSDAVYGWLYVDGRRIGYLYPNACLWVDDLRIGAWHVARVYNYSWNEIYSEEFYLDYSGQRVTIY
ncbi:MAG: hypothetical protein H5U36_05315 [Candidatus Caldatribacterium sp.]|nr:hypothetical protein [Candidatus Caldatribacterium sp.]